MTPRGDDAQFEAEALDFARAHEKVIAKKWTDPGKFSPKENPVSVFIGGLELALIKLTSIFPKVAAGLRCRPQIERMLKVKYSLRMFSFFKQKPLVSTQFSEFIRNASSEQKKRVYTEVLKKATERQNALVSARAHATGSK